MVRALALALIVALAAATGLILGGAQVSAQGTDSGVITVLSVRVSPDEPAPGDTLVVTAEVTNSGASPVEQMLAMLANGQLIASQLVSLNPGDTREITFSFQAFVAGDVQVAVGDVTELVRVVELAPTVAAPTVAPTPAVTAPTVVAAPAVAPAPTQAPDTGGSSEGKMRVGPSVRLDTRQPQIDRDRDAQIDLFWNNSELNDLPVRIEVAVDVPAGLYMHTQNGAMACAAGRCLGSFDAPPGSVRNMPIMIKADRVGEYFIQLNGRYWPEGDRDRWNPVSLSTTIEVLEPSSPPFLPGSGVTSRDPEEPRDGTGNPPDLEGATPWWLTLQAIVVYALVALVVVVTAGYKAISKSVKNARSNPPTIDIG